jgi:hypothetical protein
MRKVEIVITESRSRPGEISFRANDGHVSTFYRELAESGFKVGDRCVIISEEDYEAHFPAAAKAHAEG